MNVLIPNRTAKIKFVSLLHNRGNRNSPQMWLNKFGDLTHLRDMANTTTQQSAPVSLLFLIFIWTACKLMLSYFGSQFQWSKSKQNLTTERAIPECRNVCYRGQPSCTGEQGQLNWKSLLKCSVQYDVLSSLNSRKCHNNGGWISVFFWVVCLAAPIKLPTSSACYSKCACSEEQAHLELRSVIRAKSTVKSPNFNSGQISSLHDVIGNGPAENLMPNFTS